MGQGSGRKRPGGGIGPGKTGKTGMFFIKLQKKLLGKLRGSTSNPYPF